MAPHFYIADSASEPGVWTTVSVVMGPVVGTGIEEAYECGSIKAHIERERGRNS